MANAYKLVISEKPSVGKSIAAVLGANERKDGYFMGSGYIVSWCFGHLAELAEAAAYDEKYAKWRYEDLPILPESWQYSVARDKAKQLALLNTLMHRADVSEVINACDAGREGESIFRTVYLLNKCDKPMKRLPAGERAVLELVALRLLCAVAQSHEYTETAVTLECAGHSFSAKGRMVVNPGWRALMEAYHSGKSENESADAAKALPPVDEGQTFMVGSTAVKEGKSTPPKHYTEDTLLSAMEVAGAKEMPEDAERKGLGTPATRAAILEKLVATGFVERKKSKKTVSLIPTHAGISLITVLPEQLQSPLMTAEWEHRLKEIERGEESPETFMQGIRDMVCELVKTYKTVLGADVLFPSGRTVVGKCPRCGSDVTESKKGYFCERNDCHFGLWRDNRFLTAKKINLTKKMAETLLKDGKTYASGIFSEKTGKTYDAYIVLEDDGQRSAYKLEFSKENQK